MGMDVAITKISQNGQVVIPSEIRKRAGIKPATRFLVLARGGYIVLRAFDPKKMEEELLKKIRKSEDDIKKGKYVIADSSMSDEEIFGLLMK